MIRTWVSDPFQKWFLVVLEDTVSKSLYYLYNGWVPKPPKETFSIPVHLTTWKNLNSSQILETNLSPASVFLPIDLAVKTLSFLKSLKYSMGLPHASEQWAPCSATPHASLQWSLTDFWCQLAESFCLPGCFLFCMLSGGTYDKIFTFCGNDTQIQIYSYILKPTVRAFKTFRPNILTIGSLSPY